MRLLLKDEVKIKNIEINFSIFQPNQKKSGNMNIQAIVFRDEIKLIKHEEYFLKSTKKERATKESIKYVFEENKPLYILQIINEINKYDNRRTKTNR